MVYSKEIEKTISKVEKELQKEYGLKDTRWHAIKWLENDNEIKEKYSLNVDFDSDGYETEIINEKYDFIQALLHEVLLGKKQKEELTDKIDSYIMHPIGGILIFY